MQVLDEFTMIPYILSKNNLGNIVQDLTIYDMAFYFVQIINDNAYDNYISSITSEQSSKTPFFYPFSE